MTSSNAAVFNQQGAPAPQAQQTPKAPESPKTSFDIPTELIALPSEGKLYPPAHALHGAEGAEIRCMTAREEDLITSSAILKQGTVLQHLLSACVINKSVDVNSLLIGDRNALLIGIRVVSYGPDYKAALKCSACGHDYQGEFMLNKLRIKGLSAEPVSPGTNLFEYTLPVSKQRVRFRLMTVADSHEISVMEERKRKAKIQNEARITTPLTLLVHSIGSEEDPAKVASAIMNMRAGDSRALRGYMAKIEPGIDMTQATECPACSHASEVTVPIGASFFWPDIEG